jgi:uncharacterized membrane protein
MARHEADRATPAKSSARSHPIGRLRRIAIMVAHLIAYVVSAGAMLALDFVWLSLMTPRLYRPELGGLLLEKFNPAPAVGFYVIYALAMTVLVVGPALAAGSALRALGLGALLGFAAYATYNLSNWATLKGWSPVVSLSDIAWGTAATAIACWVAAVAAMAWSGAR